MATTEANVIEREVRIAARPETVFPFLTDPARMTRWQGIEATLDPRPGGIFRVTINGQNIARGEFAEVVANRRVVFTWGWEGEGHPVPPGSSRVEIDLIPDGDGTIVRLTHSGLPADAVADHTHGWEHYLARLLIAAAGGDPGPDPWANPPEGGGT